MTRGSLPPELERVVATVLEAAELDFTDGRRLVEEELRAHFEDGLAAGTTVAELIERFGDPVEAGRRIARTRPGATPRRSAAQPRRSPPSRHGRRRTRHPTPSRARPRSSSIATA